MKKIQFVLTLMAFMMAGAGVFATSLMSPPVVNPAIDSNDIDTFCDQPIQNSPCVLTSGRDCSYDDEGTAKTVHDLNANCVRLYKQ